MGMRYCQIKIYSPETRRWILSCSAFYGNEVDFSFRNAVFLNGNIHWVSEKSMYFNVKNERLMLMPMLMPARRRYMYFGESRGHLHLITYRLDPRSPRFEIYEMKTDYSGWFVKF
ncbi:hypothetical protein L484_000365 [Morus notabilis]|uniref:F-box associated domain-containing protein n=1 Tax=Morus notabilis TaxID=981085 RepID=W9SF13_9ROSA|nr:hypothetical protein L484_000365 [Morus notabilis]